MLNSKAIYQESQGARLPFDLTWQPQKLGSHKIHHNDINYFSLFSALFGRLIKVMLGKKVNPFRVLNGVG
jgi:hypothetical protein